MVYKNSIATVTANNVMNFAGNTTLDNNGLRLNLGGALQGPGALTFIGPNVTTLNNANTYTGGTTIKEGTLALGPNGSLSEAGALHLNGGTFDVSQMEAEEQRLTSLTGLAETTVELGDKKLTLDLAGSAVFDGTLQDGGIGKGVGGQLVKEGPGSLTLGGTNTFTGGTTINAGTISLANQGNQVLASDVTIAPVATLAGLGDIGGGKIINNGMFAPASSDAGTFGITVAGDYLQDVQGAIFQAIIDGSNGQGSQLQVLGEADVTGSTLVLEPGVPGWVLGNTYTIITAGRLVGQFANVNILPGFTGVHPVLLPSNGNSFHIRLDAAAGGYILPRDLVALEAAPFINGADGDTIHATANATVSDTTNSEFDGQVPIAVDSNFTLAWLGLIADHKENAGGIIFNGPGTLRLNNENTYTGGTTIGAGTLEAGADDTLPAEGPVTVKLGATLDLADTDQEIETLAGAGNVIIGAGELKILDNGIDSSFTGVISGENGSLVKSGPGTFTLLGLNTYGGGTTVSSGTLVGNSTSLQGDIVNNASVVFDQSSDGSYSGIMSGIGSFSKQGVGALALIGANTYTGRTLIDGGRLIMNFDQPTGADTVTIGSAGTLSGTGTIQKAVVNNGGIISPGDRLLGTGFETLTLMSGYQGSGTMDFKINATGDHSTLVSTNGSFDLRNTNLSIACATSLSGLDISQRYTLIQGQNGAENAIEGQFQSIPARVGKFVPEMIYTDNSVELSFALVRTTFASETSSANDRSIAGYLDELSGIAEGPFEDFIFSLESKSASERDDVFSQLDPATNGSMAETITTSGIVNALTQGRMHSIATGGSASDPRGATLTSGSSGSLPPLIASLSPGHGTDRPTHTRASLSQEQPGYQAFFGKGKGGVWAQGFALNHKQKSHRDIAGFGADTGGFITGIDTPFLTSNLYVGAAIGYGRGDVHYKQGRGKSKIASHLASIYALYDTETYYVDASLALGMNRYHNNRNIPVIGKTATSRHRGTEWAPHLGAGVNFTVSQLDVQPFVNLEHMHLHEAGYTEKNADFANLKIKSRSSSQWRGETGLNVSKTMLFTHGAWTPLVRLSYIRKQPHKKSKMASSFESQSQTFETETLNLKQNQVSPGLGLKFQLNNGLYVTARYDAELSKLSRAHEVGLKIGYAF